MEKPIEEIKTILKYFGADLNDPNIIDTPERFLRAWKDELFAGYSKTPEELLSRWFPSQNSQMVICRDIELYSTCSHHLLPFVGKAHVAYIPNGRVVGLSKLARVVDCFARRMQIQEDLTEQISTAIMEHLNPLGCGVIIEAQHLCMKMRGVRNHSSTMVTSSLKGVFLERDVRAEFLQLIKG